MSKPSEWSRADDAILARVAEGLEVVWIEDWGPKGREPFVLSTTRKDWLDRAPHYLTDLTAVVRAAEAWQAQEPDLRKVEIEWFGPLKTVRLTDFYLPPAKARMTGEAPTIADALARALRAACSAEEN